MFCSKKYPEIDQPSIIAHVHHLAKTAPSDDENCPLVPPDAHDFMRQVFEPLIKACEDKHLYHYDRPSSSNYPLRSRIQKKKTDVEDLNDKNMETNQFSENAGGGQLYMWGKIKSTGDDWMHPKPLMDLSGWNLRCMDSGSMHHFVGADNSCISWGHAQYGELGYGPAGQKSSAIPKKVEILDGMHVIGVACGLGHSMVIVDRTNVADRLEQLETFDGKAFSEVSEAPVTKAAPAKQNTKKGSTKVSKNSNKRKKTKDSSESEEEDEDGESENSDEQDNGRTAKGKRGGKASGRGRCRPPGRGRGGSSAASNSNSSALVKTGKRGRPRKA